MLYKETVKATTLELLKDLMHDDNLKNFFLAGGTALSLQIGHRISEDLDLFTEISFDENKLLDYLTLNKGFLLSYKDKNTLRGEINGVQIDFITHAYPIVKPVVIEEEIRLASLNEIAAMKLNAIIVNGTRAKDFVDIAYLSGYISFEQMMQACELKYKNINPLMIVRSLSHTDDVVKNVPIQLLHETYSFKTIEYRLSLLPEYPGEVFRNAPSDL